MAHFRGLVAAVLLVLAAWEGAAAEEGLPARSVRRFGTTHFRHGSRILCLAYSPDGGSLAAGGGHDPVRVWSPATGEASRQLDDPWVQTLAFLPSGKRLITAGYGKTLRLWDLETGKDVKLEGHTAAVKALALSNDGAMLLSGDVEGLVHQWDVRSQRSVLRFKAHADEVTALALSPDHENSLLVSASTDRRIHIWDLEENKKVRSLDGGCGVLALAFDAKGQTFYSSGDDHLIRRWELRTGKLLATLKGHTGIILSLALSKDGATLVSGAQDGTIRCWSTADDSPAGVIRRDPGDADALALAPDGKTVATAGLNNTIRFFAVTTGKEVAPAPGPRAPLTSLVLSPDGRWLFSAAAGHLYQWDAASGKLLRAEALGSGAVETVLALAPDGKTLACGNAAVFLWDIVNGQRLAEFPCKDGDAVLSLRFAPDGPGLAVGLRSQQVELWDWRARKVMHTLRHPAPVYAVAYSVSGEVLAAAGGNKIALFEAATGQPIKTFDTRDGPPAAQPLVAALAFAPDGKTLAAGCYDGLIRLYATPSGKEIRACEGHISVPFALAFSRDGRTLASGSFDRTVRLWETFSGSAIAVFNGHFGQVQGVAFAPDDRTLYSAAADTTALAWDVPGFGNPASLPATKLSEADLEKAWLELAALDTAKAHTAAWRLIAGANDAIPFMSRKAYLLDPEVVRQLFKDLNSESYTVRTVAMKKLQEYGRWMEGRLQTSLDSPPSLEAKRRSEQLLKALNVPGALSLQQERLRMRRLMLILEQVGDELALQLFRSLASRAPEEDLQEEAKSSLARLNRSAPARK